MLSPSTLALDRHDALPWRDSNRSGPVHSHFRNPEADVSAQAQDTVALEDNTNAEAVPFQSPAGPQEARDRGSFSVLLVAELYTNSSHQYFCFYQMFHSSKVFEFGVVSKQDATWVPHLTELVVPPLARFLHEKFRARCYGFWKLCHDDFGGVSGGGSTR
ncbi:hypothetical protein V5799_022247 [Amblyomma americanum]|uniref:Uncharacterized protein n=1 Tax=Amblyomma americanum TaxID=6943 RepID=A0AAQ4FKZ3_AMBAM